MRILVLSSVFPNAKDPLFGIFVKERIRRVVPHCEVVVVAPTPWFPFNRLFRGSRRSAIPGYENRDGLRVYHPKFFCVPGIGKCFDGFFYFLSVFPSLRRLRREFRWDLIDAHFVYPDGLAACLLAKAFGCPVTITLRGTIGKLAKFVLRRRQIQWALRSATRVFSVSGSLRDIALELGCEPGKLRVIPNGVESARFKPMAQAEARRRTGLPADATIILSVGALAERKGHQRILEVLPELLAKHPKLMLVVVGGPSVEGDTRPLLERRSAELGITDRVRLAGARPHEEIPLWLGAADLFCLATSNEGMANVIVEALACGVPVVTTRVGGNAELITEGINGSLVSPGDAAALKAALIGALERQWDRPAIAKSMAKQSWEATAAQLTKQWVEAIEAAGRKHEMADVSATV